MKFKLLLFMIFSLLYSMGIQAADLDLPILTLNSEDGETQNISVSLQILVLMTALSFLPAIFMMMTSFTRFIVVLSILRQAMGMQQTPSNQILIGIALFLTFFTMAPIFEQVNQTAIQPYLDDKLQPVAAYDAAVIPMKKFMLNQTHATDLNLFAGLAKKENLLETPSQMPLTVLVPAFVTSELKTAFQIGFLLFIPFLVIDLVIASILMGMGMMMLSPLIISLPFKIMLFVLVDGWALVVGALANSVVI